MTLYPRQLTQELQRAKTYYPIITVTGPRQAGKTTLITHIFPEYQYINLEDPDTLAQIQQDPKGFLDHHQHGVIVDEAQHMPDLLSYIQVAVDADPQRKFVITGSHQFALLGAVSQSLAGRTDVLNLYPPRFKPTTQN